MTPRPKIDYDIILTAAKFLAERIDADAETIADCYDYPMDGYELASKLDKWAGWDINRQLVDDLDDMDFYVNQELTKREKLWTEENNIQPDLPIGTKLTKGIITGICEYYPARYLVQEYNDTNLNRKLLIKFEDAVVLDEKNLDN